MPGNRAKLCCGLHDVTVSVKSKYCREEIYCASNVRIQEVLIDCMFFRCDQLQACNFTVVIEDSWNDLKGGFKPVIEESDLHQC